MNDDALKIVMIDKTDLTRRDLIEAVHIMRHEHGSLWHSEDGCGCAEWVDTMLGNYDDIVNERESTAPQPNTASREHVHRGAWCMACIDHGEKAGLAAAIVQPDTASRELREALRRAYDGGLIDAPYDEAHQWCDEDSGGNHRLDADAWLDDVRAALAATEGEGSR